VSTFNKSDKSPPPFSTSFPIDSTGAAHSVSIPRCEENKKKIKYIKYIKKYWLEQSGAERATRSTFYILVRLKKSSTTLYITCIAGSQYNFIHITRILFNFANDIRRSFKKSIFFFKIYIFNFYKSWSFLTWQKCAINYTGVQWVVGVTQLILCI
jgi:hypothetical protein